MTIPGSLIKIPLPRMQLSRKRKWLFRGIAVLFLVLAAEGASQLFLMVRYGKLGVDPHQRITIYDSDLGWNNIKSLHIDNYYGLGQPITHNSQTLRASADYTPDIPSGRYRFTCIGDSFTYGIAGDGDTYPAQLEAFCTGAQALNLGVPGHGLDQSYLRYLRDGVRFKSDVLVLGIISENFRRMSSNVFLTRYPKPQLAFDGESILTSNVPVPTWGEPAGGTWLSTFPHRTGLMQLGRKISQKYGQNYDYHPVAAGIFTHLQRLSQERNQVFVTVYFPLKLELGDGHPNESAAWCRTIAEREKFVFYDLTESFKALPAAELDLMFLPDGHYSTAGNRHVAKMLLEKLRADFPATPR